MQRCLGCMREFGEEFDVCPHCGYIVGSAAASKNQLPPGTTLQDRYTLGKVLGQGGFGITYIAWDSKIGRAVAVKEYMPNALASRMSGDREVSCFNEEAQQQFDRGLQRTRRESHALSQFGALESVVKVYDCIEENKTAYIIMELLRGRTVKEILAERSKLTFAQTMRIMTPVLQTLDAMHGVGMIHRDVAPDNIFVCDDGRIKLLDFGAARVVSGTDEKTLSVMLKHGYAPIEQYSGKSKQGAFTDVYAACATMYKMLTGETPTDSLNREKDGSDLKALAKTDLPQDARETLLRGMALDVGDRIQSARELLERLQKDAPENVAGIDPKQFLREQKKKQTKKIARIVIAAALVVCIVIGAVTLAPRFKKTAETEKEEETAQISATTAETESSVTESTQPETTTEEATTEVAKEDTQWIAAYKNYLLEQIKKSMAEAEDPSELEDYNYEYFSLIYLDNDDIPELVYSPGDYHASAATLVVFYDGKTRAFPNLGSNGVFQYKEKQGIIVDGYAGSGVSDSRVWRMENGELKCIWSGMESHYHEYDGGKAEYYLYDPDTITKYSKTQKESDQEQITASERKVSEVVFQKEYEANVPTGLTYTLVDNVLSPQMTRKNVEMYFAALADRASVRVLRAYSELTLIGTVSEKQTDYYTHSEYVDLVLDKPIVVQFEEDAFPALLTSVRYDLSMKDTVPSGHTTLTGEPYKDANGNVYL